jgi:hypothetical protein
MKIWKNFGSIVVGVSIIFVYSNCAKKRTTSVERVSDGYLITVDEESLKNVGTDTNYAVTFVDVGGQKTADRDVIKSALSDSSKYCTLEGKAKVVGRNQLRVTTDSKLTVDLNRPFATFLGVNAKRLGDLLSGGHAASSNCDCGGIPDMKQVTCHDPTSVLCCRTCP